MSHLGQREGSSSSATPKIPIELFSVIADALYALPGGKNRESEAQAALRTLLLVSTAFYREARRLVFKHVSVDPTDQHDSKAAYSLLTHNHGTFLPPLITFTIHLTLDCTRTLRRRRVLRAKNDDEGDITVFTPARQTSHPLLTNDPSLLNLLCSVIQRANRSDRRRNLEVFEIIGRSRDVILPWSYFSPHVSGALFALIQSPQLRSIRFTNLSVGSRALFGTVAKRVTLNRVNVLAEDDADLDSDERRLPSVDVLDVGSFVAPWSLLHTNQRMLVDPTRLKTLIFALSQAERFIIPSLLQMLPPTSSLQRLHLKLYEYGTPMRWLPPLSEIQINSLTHFQIDVLPPLNSSTDANYRALRSEFLSGLPGELEILPDGKIPRSVTDFQLFLSLPIPPAPQKPSSSRGARQSQSPSSSPSKRANAPRLRLSSPDAFAPGVFEAAGKALARISCKKMVLKVQFTCFECDEKKRKRKDVTLFKEKMWQALRADLRDAELGGQEEDKLASLDVKLSFVCDHPRTNTQPEFAS